MATIWLPMRLNKKNSSGGFDPVTLETLSTSVLRHDFNDKTVETSLREMDARTINGHMCGEEPEMIISVSDMHTGTLEWGRQADSVISNDWSNKLPLNSSVISNSDPSVPTKTFGPLHSDANGKQLDYGESFIVPQVTVDQKGCITAVIDKVYKIPSTDQTDYRVQQNPTNTNGVFSFLLTTNAGQTATQTSTINFSTKATFNPSTGMMIVPKITADGLYVTNINASNVKSGTLDYRRLDTTGINTVGQIAHEESRQLGYAGKFVVPEITVDAYGRVTKMETHEITLPPSDQTDYQVRVNLRTNTSTAKSYILATNTKPTTSNQVVTTVGDTAIYEAYDSATSKATLFATRFAGDGGGLTNLNASNIATGTIGVDRFPTSGVTADTYGQSGTVSLDVTLANKTFTVPKVVVDNKGRVTGAANSNVTIEAIKTVTTSSDGLMLKADKAKLDSVMTGYGSLELKPGSSAGNGGFIDFHYNNSTADYTSRLIESSSGTLKVMNNFTIGGNETVSGNSSITGNLTVAGKFNSNGDITFPSNITSAIKYAGTKATTTMISFINNSTDTGGNGIIVGGGGATIIGSGESGATVAASSTYVTNGGTENMVVAGDGNVYILTNVGTSSGISNKKEFLFGSNGQLTLPAEPSANASATTKKYVDDGLAKKLNLTGGTMSGTITYAHNSSGVSYISGCAGNNAALYSKKKALNTNEWFPTIAIQTYGGGGWSIGNYNNEDLEFIYGSKTNIDNGTNTTTKISFTSTGGVNFPSTISQNGTAVSLDGHIHDDRYILKSLGTAKGDIIYFSASGTPVRLAASTNGKYLKLASGIPAWGDPVTKVTAGVGLSGEVTTTGSIKAKLKSETASTLDSAAMGNTASRQYAVGVDKSGYLSVNIPWTNTTYNFSGTTFYSGNSSTAEHNANNAIKNGMYYYSSNGPATTLGASTDDGALFVQSYSDVWVGQIAQDYRNGNIFIRGKNNGTWSAWKKPDAGTVTGFTVGCNVPSNAKFTDTTYTFTNKAATLAWNSAVTIATIGGVDITAKLPANPNTDTKNTAGSTNTSSKIFLIGATSQAANPQTYSHDTAYIGTDGCLYSNSTKVSVEGHTHSYAASSHNHDTVYIAKSLGTAKGDIVYFSASGTPARLGVGSDGQFLKLVNGVPTWAADNNTTYSTATASADGLMSSADYKKINPQAIANNTDLNTVTAVGLYHCKNNNTALTLTNCPTQKAFTMVVLEHAGRYQFIQEYMTTDAKAWHRNYYSNSWGSWVEHKWTDTTYSNREAANGGTAVSLVTTGEKYRWNAKTSNTGTVTSVAPGDGLTGDTVTTTGTIKANLYNYTKASTAIAANMGSTTNRFYPVGLDKNGKLCVNIPWTDTTYSFSSGTESLSWNTSVTLATCGGVAIKAKLPANPNTWRGIQDNLTSSSNTTDSLSAKQGYLLANGSARDNSKIPMPANTAAGDIIYFSAANTPARLAKGVNGNYLKLVNGVPAWASASGGSSVSYSATLTSGKQLGTITIDGTSSSIYAPEYVNATTSASGLMSAGDKTKLDAITTYNNNAYTLCGNMLSIRDGTNSNGVSTLPSIQLKLGTGSNKYGEIALNASSTATIDTMHFMVDRTNIKSFYFNSDVGVYGNVSAHGIVFTNTSGQTVGTMTGPVSFTRSLSSGTKIGTITINGTGTDIYAPTSGQSVTYSNATSSTNGLMSAAHFNRVENILGYNASASEKRTVTAESINAAGYTSGGSAIGGTLRLYYNSSNYHPIYAESATILHISESGKTVKMPGNLTVSGTLSANTATTTANGLMSSGDKTKLDGIAEGATKTTITVTPNYTGGTKIARITISQTAGGGGGASTSSTDLYIPSGVASHDHDAEDITSGTLDILRGGTGNSVGYIQTGRKSGSGIGGYATAEGYDTTASAGYTHAEGLETSATYTSAHAEGGYTTASAESSHAEGNSTIASFKYSHAEGCATLASGWASHAEGTHTEATGYHSHAEGYYTTASNYYSHASGNFTVAGHSGSTACGENNDTGHSNQMVVGQYAQKITGNYFFVVGCGSSDSNRSCSLTSGSAGTNIPSLSTSGGDYAEMFEWEDGNPDNEDRVGLVVTLDEDKIRLANSDDEFILGIVSGYPSICGNTAEISWSEKFMKDEFGRPVYEYVEVPDRYDEYEHTEIDPETNEPHTVIERVLVSEKHIERQMVLNPNYDPDRAYTPRNNRKEWTAVGMIGRLSAYDDGTCNVNHWAKPGDNGRLTYSDIKTNIRVMKRINDSIVKVLLMPQ